MAPASPVVSSTRSTRPGAGWLVAETASPVDPPERSRVLAFCVAVLIAATAATVPFYGRFGLHIDFSTGPHIAFAVVLLGGLSVHYRLSPGRPSERVLTDMVLALLLLVLVTAVLAPAQYLAVALKRPLIDPWLAAADSLLGVEVARLAEWTRARPAIAWVLALAYNTLLLQFVLTPVLLGIVYKDRRGLWEYLFHFYVCAVVTVSALALFPAQCAFLYHGFRSALNQTRFIAHFTALREGSFSTIRLNDLEGLISMPSFHVAGALMVTWAFRRYPAAGVPLAAINALLVVATVMTGAHYVVDVIATAVLFAASVVAYRVVSATRSKVVSPARAFAAAR